MGVCGKLIRWQVVTLDTDTKNIRKVIDDV